MSEKKKQHIKFEQAIEKIEQIIERIESGEIGLEKAIVESQEGMKLIQHCKRVLDQAQQRIGELIPDEKQGLQATEPEEGDAAEAEEGFNAAEGEDEDEDEASF